MALNNYELKKLDELIGTLKKLNKSIEKVSFSIDESTKSLNNLAKIGINLTDENK